MRSFENALKAALPKTASPALDRAIRYSLLAPGKRIRPRLLLSCAKMLGVPTSASEPFAVALEMIHCFSLIHDDLPCMDDDDFRRGKPSNHKVFGEAIALLAGDGLLSQAFLVAARARGADPRRVLSAIQRLGSASGLRGMIGGQAAEFALTRRSPLRSVLNVHALKTGALFETALLLPADLSGLETGAKASARGKALSSFARELGAAFQVADDLEDHIQDTAGFDSVLAHLEPEQAADRARSRLLRCSTRVERFWGDRSRGLLAISSEVSDRLATYSETKAPTGGHG